MSIKNKIEELKQGIVDGDEFLTNGKNKKLFRLAEELEAKVWSTHLKGIEITDELAKLYNIKE